MTTREIIDAWLEPLVKSGQVQIFKGYAPEEGESLIEGQAGVLLSNWNHIDEPVDSSGEPVEIFDVYETAWEDEWDSCASCGLLVRISPTGYEWLPRYWKKDEGERYRCADCVKRYYALKYLRWIENDGGRANVLGLDLQEHGFRELPLRCDRGLYEHSANHDTHDIVARIQMHTGGLVDVIFGDIASGQFETGFSVFVRHKEIAWDHLDAPDGPTLWESMSTVLTSLIQGTARPGEAARTMEQALRDAARQLRGLPDGDGIKHVSINPDGTASVRILSSEEFLRGKL